MINASLISQQTASYSFVTTPAQPAIQQPPQATSQPGSLYGAAPDQGAGNPSGDMLDQSLTPVVSSPQPAIQSEAASSTSNWSVTQLSQWLANEMQLGELSAAAAQEQIDGSIAAEMSADAWREVGATALQAAKIAAAFKRKRGAE